MGGKGGSWQHTGLTFGLGLIVGCAVCALVADVEVSSRLLALPFAEHSDTSASVVFDVAEDGATVTLAPVDTKDVEAVADLIPAAKTKARRPRPASTALRASQSSSSIPADAKPIAKAQEEAPPVQQAAPLVQAEDDPTEESLPAQGQEASAQDGDMDSAEEAKKRAAAQREKMRQAQNAALAAAQRQALKPPSSEAAGATAALAAVDVKKMLKQRAAEGIEGAMPVPLPGKPVVAFKGRECAVQAANFGYVATADKCDEIISEIDACGGHFMFSKTHPDWHCRCCTTEGAEGGPSSSDWDVYAVGRPKKIAKKGNSYLSNRECKAQAVNLGHMPTVKDCDEITALTPECGMYFMFSQSHPEWACRCCEATSNGEEPGGQVTIDWNVHKVKTERPAVMPGVPTLPPAVKPFMGLPVAEGPRPGWLIKEDELVVDARQPPGRGGGVLILQAVLADSQQTWSKNKGARPRWLRAILATNREHARRHGHAMVLRAQPSQPQLTAWQWRQCRMKDAFKCVQQNERENYNWEKHKMIGEYMHSPQNFSHVLMLDADAALIRHDKNVLQKISEIMDSKHKDVFLTDEDWLDENGRGRINGGLMFVKNTAFTRNLFLDTFDSHIKGSAMLKNWRIGIEKMECSSNEQICLNDLWTGTGKAIFGPHAMMASGRVYNRGAERGGDKHMNDPKVEVMHWMGGSKGSAGNSLCDGSTDFTGDGPKGYGCEK